MSTQSTPIENTPRFLTCAQWTEKHGWPPHGRLRHLIFNADKNGFSRCIRKVGGRILLNEAEVLSWIDEQTL